LGKTVATIIGVVAVIAIAVAAPYLAPGLVSAFGAIGITISTAVATAIVTVGLSLAVAFAFKALGVGSVPKAKDQVGPPQVFRQSITDAFLLWGKRRIGGLLAFFHSRQSGNDHFRYFVVACVGHQCQGLVVWMLNDETVTVDGSNKVTSGPYANAAWLWFVRGTPTDIANATFVSECGGKWTTNHKGLGVAKIYAKFQMTDAVVQAGMPNITAVVEGRDEVYDYRTGTTGYSRNAELVFYDFMAMAREEGGFGAYPDEIPLDTWIGSEADVCDEVVNGNPRYVIDAYLTTGAAPSEVRDSIVVNCAGTYTFSGGKHYMRPGHWVPVSVTLEEKDIAAAIQVTPFLPADTASTQVTGTFIDPSSGYQGAPFTTWNRPGATDVTQMELDLGHTTVLDQANRVAAIMGKRAACEKQVVWPMNIVGIGVTTLDVAQANTSRYGLSNYAWIVGNWQLTIGDSWGAVLNLREENEEIYDDGSPVSPSTPPTIVQPSGPLLPASDISQLIANSWANGLTFSVDSSGNVTISDHTRVYSDKSVSVTGTGAGHVATGGASGDLIFIYYDDPDRAGGAVTYQYLVLAGGSGDASSAATSPTNPYRHLVLTATVPASGSSSGGSDPGSGGGGYNPFCVAAETEILFAGEFLVCADQVRAGDVVHTQHERTLEWGDHRVTRARLVKDQPVFRALVNGRSLRATGDHRIWLNGGWARMREIGEPDGIADVVQMTVQDAHTYVSNGILSHNIKPDQP
jgi:hypothetical protein